MGSCERPPAAPREPPAAPQHKPTGCPAPLAGLLPPWQRLQQGMNEVQALTPSYLLYGPRSCALGSNAQTTAHVLVT